MNNWNCDIGPSNALIMLNEHVVAVIDDTLSDWQRHARLIAAAPELLAALKDAMTAIEYYHAQEGAPFLLNAARDAIALAMGDSE